MVTVRTRRRDATERSLLSAIAAHREHKLVAVKTVIITTCHYPRPVVVQSGNFYVYPTSFLMFITRYKSSLFSCVSFYTGSSLRTEAVPINSFFLASTMVPFQKVDINKDELSN